MRRIVLGALILIAVLAAALVCFNYSKRAPKAATLLPDSTLLFLEMPDFSRSRAEFQHTALHALCQEPEVQAFLEEPRRALGQLLGNTKGTQGESGVSESILDAIQGEAFVALTRISVIPTAQAGVVFGIDVKGKQLKAEAALAYYEHELKTRNPDAKFVSKKYLGISYAVWELRPNQLVCQAFLNSMVVFTLGEDEMRDVITRFTGQAPPDAPSLAASDKYQNVLRHLPPAREFVTYLNVGQVMSLVGPFLALVPQTAGAFQKLSRIQATASSFAFTDKQIQDVGFTVYSSESKPPPVTQRKTLALTTPQTSVYAVESSDLGTLYQEIMDSIAQSGNATLISGAAQFDQRLRSGGLHIREDLLSFLGPETAAVLTWRDGATIPDAALVVEIRDATQTRPRLDLALSALKEIALGSNERFPSEEMQYLGETLHTVRVGSSLIAPTYVTTETFFILALTPDYARELLGQLKQSKPTLASNPAYQQAMKQLPGSACSYSYCDLPAVFRPLYSRLRSNLSSNDSAPFIEFNKLPQPETIARHLSPFVSATVTEPKSETTTSYSPLGKPLTFVLVAAGGFAVAQPYLAQYLPVISQGAPTTSSSTGARPRPRGNRTATSQTPPTQ
jgi:hypothetical protein